MHSKKREAAAATTAYALSLIDRCFYACVDKNQLRNYIYLDQFISFSNFDFSSWRSFKNVGIGFPMFRYFSSCYKNEQCNIQSFISCNMQSICFCQFHWIAIESFGIGKFDNSEISFDTLFVVIYILNGSGVSVSTNVWKGLTRKK